MPQYIVRKGELFLFLSNHREYRPNDSYTLHLFSVKQEIMGRSAVVLAEECPLLIGGGSKIGWSKYKMALRVLEWVKERYTML